MKQKTKQNTSDIRSDNGNSVKRCQKYQIFWKICYNDLARVSPIFDSNSEKNKKSGFDIYTEFLNSKSIELSIVLHTIHI